MGRSRIRTLALLGGVVALVVSASAPAGAAGEVGRSARKQVIAVKVKEFSVDPAVDHTRRDSVTFAVRNAGTITHELVLARLDGSRPLAVTTLGAADEASIADTDAMGEAEDVEVRTTKRFTVSGLTPGTYELFCNIVEDDGTTSHYAQGMHTVFVVL